MYFWAAKSLKMGVLSCGAPLEFQEKDLKCEEIVDEEKDKDEQAKGVSLLNPVPRMKTAMALKTLKRGKLFKEDLGLWYRELT